MPNFNQRSKAAELMDDFLLPGEEIHPILSELEIINKKLGGFQVFFDAFKKLELKNGDTICDWGCGGGDGLKRLNRYFIERNLNLNFIGIDATPAAVEFAEALNLSEENISFRCADVLKTDFKPQEFDVVISSLFTHHFEDENWIKLIKKMQQSAKKAVIINDLHRHPIAYYAIGVLTQLFSKSSMVKNDSKLSVLRSFTQSELKALLKKAEITHYSIKWMWAFRWQIIIYK